MTMGPLPLSSVEPVTETLHGTTVTDPYRWLEEQDSPRTRDWLAQQVAYAQGYFRSLPERSGIEKRVRELLGVETISEPWKLGNRYFYLKRSAHMEQAAIVLREGKTGEEIVLVDPAGRGDGASSSVNIISASPCGDILAFGHRCGGKDSQSVGFIDVRRRRTMPDLLPEGFGPALVFSEDGQGFYYAHEFACSSRPHYRAVYWHRFGTESRDDVEIFFAGRGHDVHVRVYGSWDGAVLAYLVSTSSRPIRQSLFLHDMKHRSAPRKLFEHTGITLVPFFLGEQLLALTNWKAPNLRIIAVDSENPNPDRWRDVVEESSFFIKDFAVAAQSVCVGYVDNLRSHVVIHNLAGCQYSTVPCPLDGTVRLLRRPVDSDTLFYTFSSFSQPPTIFSYHVPTSEHREWAKSSISVAFSSIDIKRVFYKSKDGTDIPMSLVTCEPCRSTDTQPLLLTGYGGFGVSLTPQFGAYSTFLLERGFRLAVAHLRGGGEFGEQWHRAGIRQNRQYAIDDFIAAAEWLIGAGLVTPAKIAIAGGSNAGLLVAAALTQRADLFRAVVSLGPLLDMLRYHRFDSANLFAEEYGTAEDEAEFGPLLAYSPYHHVDEGVSYPATLFVSGDADTRCNPMHARKMTARLQAATSSNRPILLSYTPGWGHGGIQPLNQRIGALTDRLAFICHELES